MSPHFRTFGNTKPLRQKAKTGEFTNADMVLLNKLDLAEL